MNMDVVAPVAASSTTTATASAQKKSTMEQNMIQTKNQKLESENVKQIFAELISAPLSLSQQSKDEKDEDEKQKLESWKRFQARIPSARKQFYIQTTTS